MRRPLTVLIPLIAVFAIGWSIGSSSPPSAEARPRASCKDDLAQTRQALATARAEADAARADAVKARAEVERLLARERARVQKLEDAIGPLIQSLR
jgi:hypothetical protein